MTNDNIRQAKEALGKAKAALKADDKKAAYAWAKRAAKLDPQLENAWLILAAVSSPEKSIRFLQEALKINPQSVNAQKGMAWAQKRLAKAKESQLEVTQPSAPRAPRRTPEASPLSTLPRRAPQAPQTKPPTPPPPPQKKNRLPLLAASFILLLCVAGISFFAMDAVPAQALLGNEATATSSFAAQPWGEGSISKPTYTPSPTPSSTPTNTPTPTATATNTPTSTPTPTATLTPTITNTPIPTIDYPTSTPRPQPTTPPISGGEHWIEVNLSQQMLYAYEGNTLVRSFLVSTGTWATPTVTGYFNVYLKYVSTTMSGPGYYLTDVPYTMYFYGDYGIHGAYWHNNFGTPMSHGCVNMSIPDSEWLYYFSPMGTLVYIHY